MTPGIQSSLIAEASLKRETGVLNTPAAQRAVPLQSAAGDAVSLSPEARAALELEEKEIANRKAAIATSNDQAEVREERVDKPVELPSGDDDAARDAATEDEDDDDRVADRQDREASNDAELTEAELQQVRELQARDREVRSHEQAHLAASGGYAQGGASYTYQRGPDGRQYAVGGEVSIDTGKEGTPEETIRKMQIVRRAALAPAEPSSQDRSVAQRATAAMAEARLELNTERAEERRSEAVGEDKDDEQQSQIAADIDKSDAQAQDQRVQQSNPLNDSLARIALGI